MPETTQKQPTLDPELADMLRIAQQGGAEQPDEARQFWNDVNAYLDSTS